LTVKKVSTYGKKKRSVDESPLGYVLESSSPNPGSGTPTYSSAQGELSTSVSSSSVLLAASTTTDPIILPTGGIGGNPLIYDDAIQLSFQVRNNGPLDGAEVAQVYLGFPKVAQEPPRVLRGFDKKMIKKGQLVNFEITIRNKDIAIWDVVKQAWTIPAGSFEVFVGSSSRDIHLQQAFDNPTAVTLKAS